MGKTQKQIITDILERDGRVSRNQALSMSITRLGAIICLLSKEGWHFGDPKHEGGDYVYYLAQAPAKPPKPTYQIVNGVAVEV